MVESARPRLEASRRGRGVYPSVPLDHRFHHTTLTLTEAALGHAARAWAAFRAPTADGLGAVAGGRSPELRFLAEAFDRLSREYPSTRDGLSLTERRILAAVAGGAETAGAAFEMVAAREPRPFLGDTAAAACAALDGQFKRERAVANRVAGPSQ